MQMKKSEKKRYLLDASVLVFIGFIFFLCFSKDVSFTAPFHRGWRFVLIGVAAYFLQREMRMRIFVWRFHIPLLIGGVWLFSPSVIGNTFLWESPGEQPLTFYEVQVALLLIVGLFSLQYLARDNKALRALFAVILLFVLLPPVVEWSYFFVYREAFSLGACNVILQTNQQEAYEWIKNFLGDGALIVALLGTLILLTGGYCAPLWLRGHGGIQNNTMQGTRLLYGICMVIIVYTLSYALPRTTFLALWKNAYGNLAAEQKFQEQHAQNYERLKGSFQETLREKAPGTVIFIIGESASRDYMHAYTPTFPYENTPWLEERVKEENFILFQNVYASYNTTIEVLKRTLTEASQYNDKAFEESVSILDLAKKAGYRVHWLTRQDAGGTIAAIAKVSGEFQAVDGYDENLLTQLKEIDPTQPNFIVLHLYGSHSVYKYRYPEERARWGGDTVAEYANSILYTDWILGQVYAYAKENMNLELMVYFSDHGENLEHGHGPAVHTFDSVRIPMFVYCSAAYEKAYPKRVQVLKRHRERYYSNDMLYNTMAGLLGIPADAYDEREDISSDQYGFQDEEILTFLGKRHAIEGVGQP